MQCFMITVNGWKPLTIITKRSILDVAAALDPPLKTDHFKKHLKKLFFLLRNTSYLKVLIT